MCANADVSLVDSLVAVRGRCPELMSFRLNPVRKGVSIQIPSTSC